MEYNREVYYLEHGLLWGGLTPLCLIVVSSSAAGNAFCQAAKLHMQLQSKHDSATSFVDAGNAYKKADPQGKAARRVACLSLCATNQSVLPSTLRSVLVSFQVLVKRNFCILE